MKYWLMKSEPDVFGIDELKRVRKTGWDGVRNYQVRNMMRDQMQAGDLAFFYHSGCEIPGIAGIMEIAGKGYPDQTAFDSRDHHFDADSDPDNPRWYQVDVRFKRKLKRLIPLSLLREQKGLGKMQLLKRGNRLSITPVSPAEWKLILSLE